MLNELVMKKSMSNRFRRRVAPLAAAVFAAACDSASPGGPSGDSDQPIRRIVVLGDSLAVSPTLEESFPAVLQSFIQADRLPWSVSNAGIGGDTTAGGLQRVEPLLSDDVGVLVVALGANDGLRGADLNSIESNLSNIIQRAQQRNIRVLLCGMETFPTYGWDYTLGFHSIFPRLAQRHNVSLVPFLLSRVALDPDLNGPDGVHPNATGARRIAETVWRHLEPLLHLEQLSLEASR
jgi:acyl-CoA thioesterase-1